MRWGNLNMSSSGRFTVTFANGSNVRLGGHTATTQPGIQEQEQKKYHGPEDLKEDLKAALQEIKKLKTDLRISTNKIDNLQISLGEEKRQNSLLRQQLNSAVKTNIFTEKELKVILSKVHPDKNNNSEVCNEITKKIIRERKK